MAEFTIAEDFLGKTVRVVIDRVAGSIHPKHAHIVYGINYGYVPDTHSPDGEELDAYILNIDRPLPEFTGVCVAILRRAGDSDDKLIIVPENSMVTDEDIRTQTDFQEKFLNL